jgi:hypothetical protein
MVAEILIKENMEVLGSDRTHIGFVDHRCREAYRRRFGRRRRPHEIPLSRVKHVEMKIHLNQPADQAKARWKSVGWTRH